MRRYHWILTLQEHNPHPGTNTGTAHGTGTITPAPGQTREQVFEQVKQHVCEQSGVAPARTTVMFFSLEPDELS